MSRFRSSFVLHFAHDEAQRLCAGAVGQIGWRIDDETEDRIACRELALAGGSLAAHPARIIISFSGDPRGPTEVTVNAVNFGAGPLHSSHVREQVERLIRGIEGEASRALRHRGRLAATSRRVIINRSPLLDDEVAALELDLGGRVEDGLYWYDAISGAWGPEGGPTRGFMRPGLSLGGPLRAGASNGSTGIFLNGRELDERECRILRKSAPILPGRYWLNASGEFGGEGGPRIGSLPLRTQAPASATSVSRRGASTRRATGRDRGHARRTSTCRLPSA